MRITSSLSRPVWLAGSILALISLGLGGCLPFFNRNRPMTESEFATAVASTIEAAQKIPTLTFTPVTPTITNSPNVTLRPSSTPQPSRTPAPSITPVPSGTTHPTGTATKVAGVIFMDNFDKPNGWTTRKDNDVEMKFVEGTYQITLNQYMGAIHTTRQITPLSDVRVEVDTALTAGPENGYSGVLCRASGADQYYGFVAGSDGFYAIARMLNGTYTFLERGKVETGIIKGPGLFNRVRGDCIGDTLTLYVNGMQLASVKDTSLKEGDAGLLVGTRPSLGAQLTFDNFTVIEP